MGVHGEVPGNLRPAYVAVYFHFAYQKANDSEGSTDFQTDYHQPKRSVQSHFILLPPPDRQHPTFISDVMVPVTESDWDWKARACLSQSSELSLCYCYQDKHMTDK